MTELEQIADEWIDRVLEPDSYKTDGDAIYYARQAYLAAYEQCIQDYLEGNPRWLKTAGFSSKSESRRLEVQNG